MIEAVMFWNEPNNKSHWDFEVDPDWNIFADMIRQASMAVKNVNPRLTRVVGGMSPIDTFFVQNLESKGALDYMDAVAVHGFPLDWNHWKLDEWPNKVREIQSVTHLPVWVSEVGISTFGAEEVQVFGLRRTAELLSGIAPRVHWYSLYDLPMAWPATTRHREAEGSAYYRHFYMGLLREDGTPKPALDIFHEFTPELGICQWFHFEDHRLDDAVQWLRKLGVKHLRTGLSWADSFRPGAEEWFARQMQALEEFQVTVTFCFTPEHRGIQPHHTSAPLCVEEYAQFCEEMVRRYAPAPSAGNAPITAAPVKQEQIEFPWNGGRSFTDQASIEALRFILRPDLSDQPLKVVVVCAHPGDETVGLGSRLSHLGDLTLVYVTNNTLVSFHEKHDDNAATTDLRVEQRSELSTVLERVSVSSADIRFLNFETPQTAAKLAELTRAVTAVLEDIKPDVVVTHPYAGIDPNYDPTCFAVHSACAQTKLIIEQELPIIEMSSYYNCNAERKCDEFASGVKPVSRLRLTDEQLQMKHSMLSSLVPEHTISLISLPAMEQFRPAPVYDFSRPPSDEIPEAQLNRGNFTVTWTELAAQAMEELGAMTSPQR